MATFNGGSGNDTYSGGGSGDSISGNAGNDTLYGGGGSDTMSGGDGTDSLFGGSSGDRIDGGDGNDVIDGGTSGDSITGGSGDDTINLTASFGSDTIVGSETGEASGDWLSASGMDRGVTLNFSGSEAGTISDGSSTASFSQMENFRLSGFADSLAGASNTASMVVDAGAGNDTVTGGSAADSLFGGSGNDSLTGNAGDDVMDGGTGNDSLSGGAGDDTFRLSAGFGTDTILGGETTEGAGDRIDASGLTQGVTVNYSGTEAGTISDGTSTTSFSQIETLTLTGSADSVNGTGSTTGLDIDAGGNNDTVSGGSGNDTLYGGSGADSVSGNDGNDALYGGAGSPAGTTYILNGNFSSGAANWSGTDLEAANTESAYLGNGSSNNVAEVDGNSGQTTVMQQSFTVDGAQTATLTFRSVVRSDGTVGTDGMLVEVVDANGNVISATTVLPTSKTTWADYSVDLTFPDSGTYTLRLTEVGNDDSLGALVDDVQITSTSVSADTAPDTLDGGNGNDTLDGMGGADSLSGGAGDDSVIGGDGNDTAYGGDGQDTLSGDAGNDALYGGAGADSVLGGAGADLIYGGEAGDSLYGGTEADTLYGDAGSDLVQGGDGADSLFGGDAQDTLYGDLGSDTLSGEAGADSLFGGDGNDSLSGGDEADVLSGDDGNDTLSGDAGADTLDGGAGQDVLSGGDGADSLTGGAGHDDLSGGASGDTLDAGDGNDVLDGGDGADLLQGGDGSDTLLGGTGADLFDGGTGADVIDGGADQDTILGGIGDTVSGGEGGVDQDVLDLTAFGWALTDVTYDPVNPESGTVTFYDAQGNVLGAQSFSNIEKVLVCFTPGTMITTDRGEVPVEALQEGDRVFTRDNGYQVLRWVGSKTLSAADLVVNPALRPIRIARGALGEGLPERDMRLSPQHRMLFAGPRAEMLFGEGEVLVAATHLTHLPGVERVMARGITYLHLLFDGHEIIRADGAWTESFQPAQRTLNALDEDARAEIESLFPGISARAQGFVSARPTLKAHEAKVLLGM